MSNQTTSSELRTASAGLFVMAGVSSLALLTGLKVIAVPAAALFAAAGGAMLVADAILHPENIKIPDVKIPEVKVPEINIQIPKIHVQ